MTDLSIYRVSNYRDPKMGTKTSMRELKEAIAWLILFHLTSRDSSNFDGIIKPFEENISGDNGPSICLSDDIKEKITNLYESAGLEDPAVTDALTDAFEKCTLADVQMEPLALALGIFMPLAECTFDPDDRRPKNSERKQGVRFNKFFKLSSAIRRLSCTYDFLPAPFLYLMLEWLTMPNLFSLDKYPESTLESMREIESQLREQILYLVSGTVFKIKTQDAREPEQHFNTIGLYISLFENSKVELPKTEATGSLRILKRAVKQSLLPGLLYDDRHNGFQLDPKTNLHYLKLLIEECKNYEDLSAIKYPGFENLTIDFKEKSKKSISSRNVILYGVPGSGKSYKIDQEHVSQGDYVGRVVFHPDYMYANFIGQILPDVSSGEVKYEFVPGPFTEILKKSIENPGQRHVLIIEEINRGNAAAIFGDVFQLLDRDESGASRYGIHNRDVSQLIFGNVDSEIKIPSNLVLLATMNTSDQNVFTLDTAFQRRWSMEIVPNDLTKVPWANMPIAGTEVTWEKFITEINRLITTGSDSLVSSEDKRLGAFFATEQEISAHSSRVFAEKVLKYLWDDAFKFNRGRIFIDAENRTLEDVIYAFVSAKPQKRWDAVFISKLVTQLLPVEVTVEQSDHGDLKPDSQSDSAE